VDRRSVRQPGLKVQITEPHTCASRLDGSKRGFWAPISTILAENGCVICQHGPTPMECLAPTETRKEESINLDPSVLALVVRTRKLGRQSKGGCNDGLFSFVENSTCARMCSHRFGPWLRCGRLLSFRVMIPSQSLFRPGPLPCALCLQKTDMFRAIRISWRTIPCPQALFAVTTDMFENTASTITRFMSCKS
jgi:hypothetical protein